MILLVYFVSTGNVPNFMTTRADNSTRMTNRRYFVPDPSKASSLLFQTANSERPTYDAFDQDIAIVNFYFERENVLQFKRVLRMTFIDYLAQLGGFMGFGVGFSLISGVELIYWFTVRLWRNATDEEKKNSRKGRKMNQPK